MSGAPKSSSGDALALKFLFANQDGVFVELTFPKNTSVADVKAQLMSHWPERVRAAETAKGIRLICMGRGLLQDGQTLESARVPAFPTHPTPVNVSVLRHSQPLLHDASLAEATDTKNVTSASCGCCIC